MKREVFIQNVLYGMLLLAFLLLYFFLSMNSRLLADDFYFLQNLQEHGWFNSMVLSWNTWVTRWASILWLNGILSLYLLTGNFLFYQIITLLMLCFAVYRLSTCLFSYLLNFDERGQGSWTSISEATRHSRFTIGFVISFFILTPAIGETFFWITSSAMYLWGFIAVCFLFAEVLKGKWTVGAFMISFLSALFTGGAAEAIAIPAILLLILFVVLQLKNRKPTGLTVFSILTLATSIWVSYAGDGRISRQSALPEFSLVHASLLSLKSIAEIEFGLIREKSVLLLLFFISWVGFPGSISPVHFSLKRILICSLLLLLLSFIFIFPSCLLLGDTPPQRAGIWMVFLNCMVLSLLGMFTGMMLNKPLLSKILSSVAVGILVMMISDISIEQKKITGVYSSVVDARMQFLTTRVDKEDSTAVILDPLPDSGMLLSSEIGKDPSDFRNQHLKNYLGIRANVIVK